MEYSSILCPFRGFDDDNKAFSSFFKTMIIEQEAPARFGFSRQAQAYKESSKNVEI